MGNGLKYTLIICATLFVAIIVSVVYVTHKISDTKVTVGNSSDAIDITPTLLTEMREIGQWEFLSISDEELQDTIRRGFFSDDELVRIYYGTLRIGIDFSQCDETWFSVSGDSVRLNLPPVRLLDNDFLDETRTRPFIETGTWSNADRKAMADRARYAMRRRCLTESNMKTAQQNAEKQVGTFLKLLIDKQNNER